MKTLIVDDEPQARAGLRHLLEQDPEIEIVGESANGRRAVQDIAELRPDLVLLDIQMPGLDGFGVLAELDLNDPPLFIFVTAHDEHTLRAFEVHALDYLLKPFTDARFRQAIERAKVRHRERQSSELGDRLQRLLADQHKVDPEPQTLKRFAIKRGDETQFVDCGDVRWIEAEEYCVRLHLRDGRSHLLRGNLGSFEPRLDPSSFQRTHRSAIVNLHYVRSLRALFKGRALAVLDDGTQVPVSRNRRAELESRLEIGG